MQVSIYLGKVDFAKTNIASPFQAIDWDELLPDIVRSNIWSGCTWKNGYRKGDNFIQNELAVLDFDEPGVTLVEAVRSFCDQWHIIGTTKSHQKEKNGVVCDRFRIVLRFEHPITNAEQYKQNMGPLIKKWDTDKKCGDAARYFFPCQEIISVNLDEDSYKIEVADYIPPKPRPPSRAHTLHHMSSFARAVTTYGAPNGVRNDFAHRCYFDLRASGFDSDLAENLTFAKIRGLSQKEITSIKNSVEKYLVSDKYLNKK